MASPTHNTPSDPDLVRRCLADDQQAWTQLTERYADLIFGLARRSGLGAAEAGDVVQEVYLALVRNLSRLRRQERLLAWILKTARRESWRQVKRQRALRARDEAAAVSETASAPLPAAVLQKLEREQAVREGYGALGERCRRLLDALFFQPQRSYTEVAADIGIAVGSIGPTRQRCLARLREELEKRGFPPPDVSDAGGSPSTRVEGNQS